MSGGSGSWGAMLASARRGTQVLGAGDPRKVQRDNTKGI